MISGFSRYLSASFLADGELQVQLGSSLSLSLQFLGQPLTHSLSVPLSCSPPAPFATFRRVFLLNYKFRRTSRTPIEAVRTENKDCRTLLSN